MAKRSGKPIVALCCLFLLGVISGSIILRYAQYRGESREIKALRFELRKYGAIKGYTDADLKAVADNASYCFVEDALAKAVVKAENARDVALGGVLSPISRGIRERAAAREWPHYQLVKGLQFYQIKFVRKHPDWWAKHCIECIGQDTTRMWKAFFWNYRSRFLDELANGWLAAHDDEKAWKRNVLLFWKGGR
jgi:hypothetical protein